ncbi:MAG: hypothetical protein K5906_04385 [Bacilli bacterium]|nr:hypothetical protein [Bacilli bacterium]
MTNNELYLEPLKYYENGLKDTHRQNVEEYFEKLTQDSGVDIGENKATCTKYYCENKVLDKLKSSLGWAKFWAGFMIFLIVLCFALGIIFIISSANNSNWVLLGIGIGLIPLGVLFLVLRLTTFKKKKNNLQEIVDKKQKEVDQIQREAFNQMYPLIASFKPYMAPRLMEKTAPLINFEEHLSSKTLDRIVHQFKDKIDDDIDHSTLVVQSGHINTNPFLLRQKLVMEMVPHIYTGTLLITYTRTVSDGKGGTRTITVTQTLTASISRPLPTYNVHTTLNYYNDASSKLSFYRTPAGLVGKNEKQIERATKKEDKENTKKAENAVKKGQNYTKFANSKFEAFINSEDRDNELEYRLLFTPLAQNNFVYTLSKVDDFYVNKNKCIYSVSTTHDAGMDYSGDTSNFTSFDYEVIKNNFISYNMNFFHNLYFDFLPILSIPLYIDHQSQTYIDNKKEDVISYYEAEVLINKFDPECFKPKNCDTDVILKPVVSGNNIMVTSYGFHADPRTEFVPVLGGDGFMHPVPVPYYEYLPLKGVYNINVMKNSATLDNNDDSVINYKEYSAKLIK